MKYQLQSVSDVKPTTVAGVVSSQCTVRVVRATPASFQSSSLFRNSTIRQKWLELFLPSVPSELSWQLQPVSKPLHTAICILFRNFRQQQLELFLPSATSELSGNSSQFQNLFTLQYASSSVILGNSSWSCFFPMYRQTRQLQPVHASSHCDMHALPQFKPTTVAGVVSSQCIVRVARAHPASFQTTSHCDDVIWLEPPHYFYPDHLMSNNITLK